jgi:hypothetical protein
MDCPSPAAAWVFGNQPLPQTLALAPILRRLTERALSLEQEDEGFARFIEELSATERALEQRGPRLPRSRAGHREIQPVLPRVRNPRRRRAGLRDGLVPARFRGAPGDCSWRVLGRVLRLRHPAPQL